MLVGFSYAMHVYYIYCLIKLMIDWFNEKSYITKTVRYKDRI